MATVSAAFLRPVRLTILVRGNMLFSHRRAVGFLPSSRFPTFFYESYTVTLSKT